MDEQFCADVAHDALYQALQEEPGRILSVLVHAIGDIDLAEDALQDAAATALARWPRDGVPANPAGWLVTAARRNAIDRVRRVGVERRKHAEIAALTRLERHADRLANVEWALGDERLTLIFACCHPALPMESRVALTLRTLGGLDTAEVARAFLVRESAMKQRITRAKRTIREAHVPLSLPSDDLLEERLPGVLAVVYLIFNEGYASTRGDTLTRVDLCEEAVRLSRLVAANLPSAETLGLLALLLFHDARASTRHVADGSLIPMDEQDRSEWNRAAIDEANTLLAIAATAGSPGQYQLQAAIASIHANAAEQRDTNWRDIVQLYDGLIALAPSAVFRLNRAVAYGMAHGPAAGLRDIEALEGLDEYHLFHASRADMLRRLDRPADAANAYRAALAGNHAERRHLERRIRECACTMAEGTGSDERDLDAGDFSSWMTEMQAAIRSERGADVPCAGCTACCTSSQFVHIGPDETETLSHIPSDLMFPAPRMPRGHVLLGYDEHGHCPMLVDNECSIYEHRPRTCRTYDCRVFPATALDVDDDKIQIARRARRWQFNFRTDADRNQRDAVRAAARFLDEHADLLPDGAVPTNTTQRAVLAIEIHGVFLRRDNETGQTTVVEPDTEIVRDELARRRQ